MAGLSDIDWVDVGLHIVVPAAILLLLGLTTPDDLPFSTPRDSLLYALAGFNTVFWPVREALQAPDESIRDWSLQKHLEAWPSVVVVWALLVAMVG